MDQARRSACAAGRTESGAIRVGLLTSLAGGFLRRLIMSYQREYPKVRVDLRDGGRDEHVASLRARDLDIVFLPCSTPVRNCECAELWCEQIHIALCKGHRLAGKAKLDWPDLCEEEFITSCHAIGPELHDYIAHRLAEHAPLPKVEIRCACFETLMNLVSLGQGITATSSAWTDVKFPDLILRPLSDPRDVLRFSAIWLAENDNPALRCLVSTAHVLAGRVRRGNSDWLPRQVSSD
nr:LysR family substrate-binding domain-containing protein [Rhizobium sp. L1K21]